MKNFFVDFGQFLNAVFWRWQAWLGGSGGGGAVVVLLVLYQSLTGRNLSKRMYIYVFIIAFLFFAFFAAWRDQYQRVAVLSDKLSELTVPKLEGEIDMLSVGTTPKTGDAVACIWIHFRNRGAPTVIDHLEMFITTKSGKMLPTHPWSFGTGLNFENSPQGTGLGKNEFKTEPRNYLPNRVTEEPIPTNGGRSGWLDGTASGIKQREVYSVTLKCRDIDGKPYEFTQVYSEESKQ